MTSVDDTQPLITHLVELRNRLLRSIIFVAVVFVALVYFSNEIYNFVAAPLTANLPNGSSMIATNIATPFFTPIKLTGVVAIFISVPFLLFLPPRRRSKTKFGWDCPRKPPINWVHLSPV